MMYRIVYRIVALVPRYVSVAKKIYRCSPTDRGGGGGGGGGGMGGGVLL